MKKQKIVIKIGSTVISGNKDKIDKSALKSLTSQITKLIEKNNQVVLVTSGAVSSGNEILNLDKISDKVLRRQMLASLGQTRLIQIYSDFFAEHNIKVAQILLVRKDFIRRTSFDNFQKMINELLEYGVVPIINENDAIAVENYAFLDNDQLAAFLAIVIEADVLINLTNIDGLYSADPKSDKNAELIKEVKNGGEQLEKLCSKKTSKFGIGGMLTKVRTARLAAKNGIKVIITNGLKQNAVLNALSKNPDGTIFYPVKKNIANRKKWLLVGASAGGKIEIDSGAAKALKNNKSLLAVGISDAMGEFKIKDIVEIVDQNGNTLACGIVNYSKIDIDKAIDYRKKNKNDEIKKKFDKEVIHADNLTIL